MDANYGPQSNSLEGFPDDLGNRYPGAGQGASGDGLGFLASGSGALGPLAPNFESYQPFENPFDDPPPLSADNTLFSGCGTPGLDQQLPSFPETFGVPAAFPPHTFNATAPDSNSDFIPPHHFLFNHYAPAALPPPPPPTGLDVWSTTRFGGLDISALPMPLNPGTHAAAGEAYYYSSGGTGTGLSVCPFAPRFNPQRNHQDHHNHIHHSIPAPPQSNRSSVGDGYQNSIWHPFNPRLATDPSPRLSDPASVQAREPESDDYIAALLSGNFSSPSLQPLSSSPPRPSTANTARRQSMIFEPSSPLHVNDNMPRDPAPINRTAASNRPRRGSSAASMVDLTSPKTERDAASPAAIDLTTPMAPPPTRKRTRTTPSIATPRASSRRLSASAKTRPVKPLPSKRKSTKSDDDLFGDSSSLVGIEDQDADVLDLTSSTEVPAELLQPKVDNRTKLSKFQCSICMDDVAGLTVTHCGHLFCSECLHSALHIDHMKKTCPICRQKVDVRPRPGQKQGKNTYFHLELKLMTANRKGKRPVGQ